MITHEFDLGSKIFKVEISPTDIAFDLNEIGFNLGYYDGIIPEYFKKILNEAIGGFPARCSISAGYRLVDIENSFDRKNGIAVEHLFFKTEKIVAKQFEKAEKAAIFVCTIGPAMETWSKELMSEDNPVTGFIVDSLASTAVEKATDILHSHIGAKMQQQNLGITNRYSPGYCNWHVSEQHLLFSLLPENFCGIKLTDTALMLPIKSVSGIIGIGKKVKMRDYNCDRCGVKECTYRTKKYLLKDYYD